MDVMYKMGGRRIYGDVGIYTDIQSELPKVINQERLCYFHGRTLLWILAFVVALLVFSHDLWRSDSREERQWDGVVC